jgi:hypothetical protein
MWQQTHQADVCVIGGGMAGLCAAAAAARHGASVILMHERPVLGGNASSEVRMHICGADRGAHQPNMRETGILEEVRLANLARNPQQNYSVWDTLLYELASFTPGLKALLNCTCLDAAMSGKSIESVIGWQLTTETFHTVKAKVFLDCSGDGILAPLTGAEFRMGREGRNEFGESIAPERADRRTMGMTCVFAARQFDTPQPFTPPAWSEDFPTDNDLPYGGRDHRGFNMGYWWIELGGEGHSIRDTERLRDELLKIVFGVWDHIKNHGDHGAENWALDWVEFLPGKRESRRFIGDHILTQLDVEAEGKFPDIVAYGGWSMDDHHPAGFRAAKMGQPATIFHPAPSPYGIPYRCLYSRNIDNLLFAGRNASCTHAAMSSTRVMGTCSAMGQAAGTAAALAVCHGALPRDMNDRIGDLQQMLLRDDCYLPGVPQRFEPLTMTAELAASQGDPALLRDGINRPVGDDPHAWPCKVGDWVSYTFPQARHVREATVIVDSALDKNIFFSRYADYGQLTAPPPVLPKAFRLEGLQGGEWKILHHVTDNYQRLVRLPVDQTLEGVRFTLDGTWGNEASRLYAFYLDE